MRHLAPRQGPAWLGVTLWVIVEIIVRFAR